MSILSNELVGINQILPHKNKWAWDLFLKGCNNHWMPTEISMEKDIKQWNEKDFFSKDEKLVVKRCLGFFAGAESLVSNNLLLTVFKYINDGECRQYLFRQMMEECYTEGTQVLTENGWKEFKDINNEDKVAQFNLDKTIEFVNFLKKQEYDYSGEIYKFYNESNNYYLEVTPNHRMVAMDDSKNIIIQEANKISYAHKQGIVAGIIKNNNTKILTPYEKLMIAFQADGSYIGGNSKKHRKYRNGNRSGYIALIFCLTKKRKINRLLKILIEGKYKFKVKVNKHGKTKVYVWINKNLNISKYFKDIFDLKNKSLEWHKDFIHEVCQWDGHEYENCIGYDTTEKLNADFVQSVSVLCGYRTHYSIKIDDRKESYKDLYSLSFVDKDFVCRGIIKKEKINLNLEKNR
jgi:hypothetical protein